MPPPDVPNAPIDDLQCARCGTELDEVDPDGDCPDCRVPVALSAKVHAARLAFVLRVCRTCGYRLLGLPDSGACPECGRPYTRESLIRRYIGYLEDSWLLVLQVPLVALLGLTAGLMLFRPGRVLGSALGIAVLLGCGVWAWQLSWRMAAWHYLIRLEATLRGTGPEVTARYKTRLALVLFAIQVALLLAPWLSRLDQYLRAVLGAGGP